MERWRFDKISSAVFSSRPAVKSLILPQKKKDLLQFAHVCRGGKEEQVFNFEGRNESICQLHS